MMFLYSFFLWHTQKTFVCKHYMVGGNWTLLVYYYTWKSSETLCFNITPSAQSPVVLQKKLQHACNMLSSQQHDVNVT